MNNLLKNIRKVYLIGIKGTGMSALAVNLKHMGMDVVGSDFAESFFTDALLARHQIKVVSPFSASNVPSDADLVISSTAYNTRNEELAEAEKRGLKILTYPEVIGLLSETLPSIAVCGSHGKTTVSAVVGYVFSRSKYRPLINVGSVVPQLIDYQTQNPELFIFEADEYQNKLRHFKPDVVIMTNVDYDHPDFFTSPEHYQNIYRDYVERIPENGFLIYCRDDENACRVAQSAKSAKVSYGFNPGADYVINISRLGADKMVFEIRNKVGMVGVFESGIIGRHNALNLTAAIICANYFKIPPDNTKCAIKEFTGASRRLEIKKKVKINGKDCLIIDDYGHHPTEIKATISTIKAAYPDKQLWVVFQPHTFSRTKIFIDDFARSFDKSDKTIVLNIYGSKREAAGDIHSRDLIEKMVSVDGGLAKNQVFYEADIGQAAEFIKKSVNRDSVILTIGASNVWELVNLL